MSTSDSRDQSLDKFISYEVSKADEVVPGLEGGGQIPVDVRAMLPGDTANTWVTIAPIMPASAYLVGGTALAVHLRHRSSRDLDFFLETLEDLGELWTAFQKMGRTSATSLSSDSIDCFFNGTKVQVIEATSQRLILPTTRMAGIRIASVQDIMATKVKVILSRGELRDYFDLMHIELDAGIQVETGIALAIAKYEPRDKREFVYSALVALGSFGDVADDPGLPTSRKEIETYWARRQIEVAKRYDSFGGS